MVRRAEGIPTISVLVGPPGATRGVWSEWAKRIGVQTLTTRGPFPLADWFRKTAENVSIPDTAVRSLRGRCEHSPDRLLTEWGTKTQADRERFWDSLTPCPDDDILRALSMATPASVVDVLQLFGDKAVSLTCRLLPTTALSAVQFVVGPGVGLVAGASGIAS